MEQSQELRRQGNAWLHKSKDPSWAPTLREGMRQKAVRLYNMAFVESVSDLERASCKKNIGVVSFRQAIEVVKHQDELSHQQGQSLAYHLKESVASYFLAEKFGKRLKGQEWLDGIKSSLQKDVDEAIHLFKDLKPTGRRQCLHHLSMAFSDCAPSSMFRGAAATAHLEYGEFLFHHGIQMLDASAGWDPETLHLADGYPRCLNALHDCFTPLTRAHESAAGEPALLERVEDLRDQVYRYQCTCEALQAIALGSELVRLATQEDISMDIEGVWASVDKFKEAALLTREKDLETEAMALYWLGRVFAGALRMMDIAHKYASRAVQLGLTLLPMAPRIATAKWYKDAVKSVGEYQRQRQAKEEAAEAKEKGPVLAALKNELQQLAREAESSAESLLNFVYETHPPKDKGHTRGDLGGPVATRKALVQAILHYHPDRNMCHGLQWQVLCEEITKYLNRKYEYFK